MTITEQEIRHFTLRLRVGEKSPATIEKYRREAARFAAWLAGRSIEDVNIQDYKEELSAARTPAGVNGALAALNCLFDFLGVPERRLKSVKIQRRIFRDETRELPEK